MSQIQNMQMKNSTKQSSNTSVPSIIKRRSVAGAIRKFRFPLNMEMTSNGDMNTSESAMMSNTGGMSKILQNHKQFKALKKDNISSKNPLASQKDLLVCEKENRHKSNPIECVGLNTGITRVPLRQSTTQNVQTPAKDFMISSQKPTTIHSPKLRHIPMNSQPQVTLSNAVFDRAIVSPRMSHPSSCQNDHLSTEGGSRNMQSLSAQIEENATNGNVMTTAYEDHTQRTTPVPPLAEMESHPQSNASPSNGVSNEGQTTNQQIENVDVSASSLKKCYFNENGQPIGEDSTRFSTTLGNFVRSQCPIFYEDWREMPYEYKERVLHLMKKEGFQIPDQCAQKAINMMDKPWRSFKYSLRNSYYDKHDTIVSKKRNCPSGVRPEDWERFVDMQVDADYRRPHGKKARSCVKLLHTSGRRGAARTAENLKAENSSETVSRTDLFLATHFGKDGSALTPEANEQLQQIRAMTRSNPTSTSLDVDHDPVAQVCGPDGHGSVRGMDAGVTKTALKSSAPARYKLQEETAKRHSLEDKVNTQGGVIEQMKDLLETQGKMIADLNERLSSQSPQARVSNDSVTSRARGAQNVYTPPTPIVNSTSPSPAIEQTCQLLAFGGDVVAYGRMLSQQPAIDGVFKTKVYKVVIDVILEPDAPLFKKEGTSSLLRNVGEGSTIIWPKIFTRL